MNSLQAHLCQTLFFASLLFSSCSDSETLRDPEIFAVGDNVPRSAAVLWHGFREFDVEYFNGWSDIHMTSGHDIFVSGNDVFVAGEAYSPQRIAAYWKNGTLVRLPGDFGIATSIVLANDHIYIAGTCTGPDFNPKPSYWKDGQLTFLDNQGEAYSVFVSGSDIYVAGMYQEQVQRAAIWKNGERQLLAEGSLALDIAVSRGDVHVVGRQFELKSIAYYWKNGIPQILPEGLVANSVSIIGGDVYITGISGDGSNYGAACYWKNGELVKVGVNGSSAVSVFVFNGDVFVGGNSHGTPCYWKNSIRYTISTSPETTDLNSFTLR